MVKIKAQISDEVGPNAAMPRATKATLSRFQIIEKQGAIITVLILTFAF